MSDPMSVETSNSGDGTALSCRRPGSGETSHAKRLKLGDGKDTDGGGEQTAALSTDSASPVDSEVSAHANADTKASEAKEKKKPLKDLPPAPPHRVDAGKLIHPGNFDPENHFYPRVINAQIHPMVSSFMSLGNDRIAIRYCHLHPRVNAETLRQYLKYQPRYFRWAGMYVRNAIVCLVFVFLCCVVVASLSHYVVCVCPSYGKKRVNERTYVSVCMF